MHALRGSTSSSISELSPKHWPGTSLSYLVNHCILRSSSYFSADTAFKLYIFLILSSLRSSSNIITSCTSESSSEWISISNSSTFLLLSVSTLCNSEDKKFCWLRERRSVITWKSFFWIAPLSPMLSSLSSTFSFYSWRLVVFLPCLTGSNDFTVDLRNFPARGDYFGESAGVSISDNPVFIVIRGDGASFIVCKIYFSLITFK